MTRLRDQSPGAASVGSHASGEDLPSARRHIALTGGGGGNSAVRRASLWTPSGKHSRDPRPVGERVYASQCARNVIEFVNARGFGRTVSYEKFLRDPSIKEFTDIFKFLVAQLDPQLPVEGKMEDEVHLIMKRLKYPTEVNRSKLQAISGPNTWPQLLAVLDWLIVLIQCNEEVINPAALNMYDYAELPESDENQIVQRSLMESYTQYLRGDDEEKDEQRIRNIYEERTDSVRQEIERLQVQHDGMEQSLHDFKSAHDRLVELQNAPRHLEIEADRLRVIIQSADVQVQRMEDEMKSVQDQNCTREQEIEGLEANVRQLTEQVQGQAYSKKDLERLKCERSHLRHILENLKVDCEKVEQGVWEQGIEEQRLAEKVGRTVRRVNEAIESAELASLSSGSWSTQDLVVRVDLGEPMDALAALDFSEGREQVRAATEQQIEAAQREEAKHHEVLERQRIVQEELSEKDRECRRLKTRVDQIYRMREEQREWSATQLDDAQRTTEETEDAVHAASLTTAAPSLREAAEVDELRMQLAELKSHAATERTRLEEQLARDEEKFRETKQRNCSSLINVHQTMDAIANEVRMAVQKEQANQSARGGGA